MEYVHAALLLYEGDREITEDNLTAVLEAAGIEVEATRAKALVAALADVDIEEAVATPAGVTAQPAAATAEASESEATAGGDEAAETAADEDESDEDEDEGPSGEGLGELFG